MMTAEQVFAQIGEIAKRQGLTMPDDPKLFFAFCADVISREMVLIDDAERELDENENE